jgi:hypothetical protein
LEAPFESFSICYIKLYCNAMSIEDCNAISIVYIPIIEENNYPFLKKIILLNVNRHQETIIDRKIHLLDGYLSTGKKQIF